MDLQTVKLLKQVGLLQEKSGPNLSAEFQVKVHQHTGLEAAELLWLQVGNEVLNPESLYLFLRSFEVREMLADDFIYFTEGLLISGCVTHH